MSDQNPLEPPPDPDFVDRFADQPAGEREPAIPELPPPPAAPEPPVTPAPPHRPHPPRRPSFFWPLLLIGAGVILLLQQFDLLPADFWGEIWRFWPVLIILVGLDLLLGRRSFLGSLIGALIGIAIIVGIVALLLSLPWPGREGGWNWESDLVHNTFTHDRGRLETADVRLDLNRWRTAVGALSDSPYLIEAELDYVGDVRFDVTERGDTADIALAVRAEDGTWFWGWPFSDDGRWQIDLSPDVLLDLTVDVGSGSAEVDLDQLMLDELVVEGGSGSLELSLPEARGLAAAVDGGSGSLVITLPGRGDLDLRIEGGSGSIQLYLPASLDARVELTAGSGSFSPGGRLKLVEGEQRDDGVWQTDGYPTAESRVLIVVDQGSGSLTIRD